MWQEIFKGKEDTEILLSPWEAGCCSYYQEIICLWWNQKFHCLFTRALHWSVSSASWTPYTIFHSISLRSILIVSFHLCLGLLSGLLFMFSIQAFLISSMYATCPTHLILHDLIILILFDEQITKLFVVKFSPDFNFTYVLHGATVLVELWPPHIFYVRFRDNKFLQGRVVSPTPNPQPGGPGYLS
jgi:hypothetical protein